MGDAVEDGPFLDGRPVKRVKVDDDELAPDLWTGPSLTSPFYHHGLSAVSMPAAADVPRPMPWAGIEVEAWPMPGSAPVQPLASQSSPPQSASSALSVPDYHHISSPASPIVSRPSQVSKRPRCLLPPPAGDAPGVVEQRTVNSFGLVSPFRDCVGIFGQASKRRFARPVDGKVNGYIKFNWPVERPSRRESLVHEDSTSASVVELDDETAAAVEASSSSSSSIVPFHSASSSVACSSMVALSPDLDSNFDFSGYLYGSSGASSLELLNAVTTMTSPSLVSADGPSEVASMGAPRKVPHLFGYEAKMDPTDRKFWAFYIKNWCPGRSVLSETNLWLKDFAQMHKSDGVRAAIQSLAGIYIYDYRPLDSVRKRVNDRFFEAESRLSLLLSDPLTSRSETQANELITISVLLSMQDIVLTERRLRKPHDPRWLAGFKQGEHFLQATDQGSRFWKRSNAQLSSLRVSQAVIVGRALILAQPMMKLTSPETLDPEYEASRFGWLLYGTERDMYEIHGGCGFSKKLLHIFSQITYCAARLQQDPHNVVTPTTTRYLYAELLMMRQWSSESKDWEAARAGPSVIEWARSLPFGHVVSSSADMTDVTAEAWRLAAIIYLQCRVWRFPRNHPDVVETLSDLAQCIRIMPTSGYHFTAQAPLFPVFLLGMLATDVELRNVSKTWFDEVVSTPVRSSVPPLYEVLQRIWQWIDTSVPLPPLEAPVNVVGLRPAWWETIVHQVDKREPEVLCLT
ncbi:hypothetical protein CDD80_7123 [Ophiocordyceps camponoti-rufipedis]|uniref:Transcription factor domain-containing protein n=1 Tax=Ophiocordyceps camponoti-rufipedis TaxID=2004952 RepID=A0A2C5XDZ1_9HYPO|nr:hypothetical protein CDD80_7123 [Ophiocordyceps camponoti-rufipedis]